MKLSQILARILVDVELRKKHKDSGLCCIVQNLTPPDEHYVNTLRHFEQLLMQCKQTKSWVYPVAPADVAECEGPVEVQEARNAFCEARDKSSMWRGQYGLNRRKLLRDCLALARKWGL